MEVDPLKALRDRCRKAGSQKAAAEALGVSGAYLTDVLLGRRAVGQKLLDGLGIERVVTYRMRAP